MKRPTRHRVVVEDAPTWPTPNRTVFHAETLRLRRLARGIKT